MSEFSLALQFPLFFRIRHSHSSSRGGPVIAEVNYGMAEEAQEILLFLAEHKILDSYQYACDTGKDHQIIIGAIKSLQSLGNVSTTDLIIKYYNSDL